jgi:flagellar protein FlaG
MTIQAISQAGIPATPPTATAAGSHNAPVRQDQTGTPRFPVVEEKSATSAPQTGNTRPEDIRNAVEKLTEFVSPVASDIQFSIDEDTDTTVVKIVDRNTQEVIRQIPSEEMLEIAKALDRLQGLLIRQKA